MSSHDVLFPNATPFSLDNFNKKGSQEGLTVENDDGLDKAMASLMTEFAKDQVLKKYNITDTKQMPSISRYDPVALAIGLRPGQICKITRSSKTSVTSIYYRYCVTN